MIIPHPKWYKDKTEKQREYRKRRKAREQKARLEEYERIKQQYSKELGIEVKNETVVALESANDEEVANAVIHCLYHEPISKWGKLEKEFKLKVKNAQIGQNLGKN